MKHFSMLILATSLGLLSCKSKPAPAVTAFQAPANQNSSLDYLGGSKPADRLFPDKLRGLPNEIVASHYPNPCFASYEDSMYTWKHSTSITAKEDLQIVEYGSFVYTAKGFYLRVTMSPDEFAAVYKCEKGLLKKGVTYKDNASWRQDKQLRSGDAVWYFIARTRNGKLVKGMAPIETEGSLLNSDAKAAVIRSSALTWTGYGEVGGYALTGSITLKDAEIMLHDDSVRAARIIFDMRSITHENKQLESHLKDDDFFAVAKFPVAIFEAETVRYLSPERAMVKGTLTIKNVSKPISFPVNISKGKDMQAITGKITVDRTLFGIKYNSSSFFASLGDDAIKNDFDLAFKLEISR